MRKFSLFLKFSILFSALLIFIAACAAPQPNLSVPTSPPPAPAALKGHPRVALVLGGGGARGMAHVGVLKVFREEQIPIDLIVGTSAGSIVGALYADHPNTFVLENTLMQTGLSNILDFTPSLEGPVSGYGLQNFILQHTRAHYFNQLKIPMIAVATDLKTGKPFVLDSGPIAPAINASAALAPVFRPVNLYGHTFVDGGFTDLVPVDVAKRYQPKVIIAVNIAPNIPSAMPGNIIGVYNRAYLLGDARFVQFNTQGADVVLHPHVGQAGTFDPGDKSSLLQAGETAARRALPQICALLRANNIPSKCS